MMLKSFAGLAAASAPMIADHLWQTTLFAAAVGAVTLAFRRNQARVRFALWLAASLKFLIPFSLLIGLGGHLASPRPLAAAQTGLYSAMQQVSQPFAGPDAPVLDPGVRPAISASLLPATFVGLWLCGFVAVLALWCMRWVRISMATRRAAAPAQGREVDALRRLQQLAGVRRPIPLLVSPDSMEPGIFGIFRPVLVWPHGISDHLEDAHLEAILAHEVGHVRRRDNLSAALHMLVEAVFWFHPLVWWLGTRLIDERERACDQEVLGLGNQPEVYAESILKACKFCVESPLPCVSGVAGSDLKKRIVRIMDGHLGIRLGLAGKLALAVIGLVAVSAPIAIGIFNAAPVRAQEPESAAEPAVAFDEASIEASDPGDKESRILTQPGSFVVTSVTLKTVIALAYGVQGYQLAGLPDWVKSEKFDIEARWKEPAGGDAALVANPPSGDLQFVASGSSNSSVAPPPPPPLPPGAAAIHQRPFQLQAMLQKLLADRFNLRLSHESRDLPVYNLVVADTGSKLTPTPSSPQPPVALSGKSMITVHSGMRSGNHELMFTNTSPAVFADLLSQQLGRKVLDETGLTGQFDITLQWGNGESEPDQISAALENQLGLKLESDQAPVDVLVIDQVERPVAD
jgi:bla regulator protein blaR1